MSLGITEITLVLIAVVILFGGKRIPELARSLGKASAEYKKAKETLENEAREFKQALEDETKSQPEPYKPTEG